MTARIKIATTPEEIDAVFKIRHRVYAEEEGHMARRDDGRIYDRFDALPTAVNIIAVVDGQVVGTVRFMEGSLAGTSADTFFNFAPHLDGDHGRRIGASSQLAVAREYRKSGLSFSLLAMGCYWALGRGVTTLKSAANPDVLPMLLRMGWEPVAPEFFHEGYGLRCVPMVLELAKLNDKFLEFISRQEIPHFLKSFERQFHVEGETVVRAGEEATDAFVVVHGEAIVHGRDGRELARLGPGDVVGEIALVTGSRRTATVTAGTELDLMVLSRDAFDAQISADPTVAMRLLRLVASRLAPKVDELAARAA